MNMNGIMFESVSFGYEGNKMLLSKLDLVIPQKTFFAITGANGSGKTTMTLFMNGLIPNEITGIMQGNVFIDGENTRGKSVSHFAKKIGMVFQNPDFMLFNLTVREEIEFGLKNLHFENCEKRVKDALDTVDMSQYIDADPHELSLGQKQKISLACVLAMDTPYIVLDEPTSMLDHKSAVSLYALLGKLNKQGKTIIIVEHDTDFLVDTADTISVVDKGTIVFQGNPRQVFSKKKLLDEIGVKIPYMK